MAFQTLPHPSESRSPVTRFNRGADLPWLPLATGPTPVAKLSRLGEHYGLSELWVKRDDLTSPLYGGNKVRKLEFLLADAVRCHSRSLLTVGAVGSHHVLATARFGRELGLSTTAVVVPQPTTAHVAENLRLGLHWGVHYVPVRHPAWLPIQALAERLAQPGAYYIPAGGSSVLGTLGYVNAALELAVQIRAGEMPQPRAIVVATGSAGTHAGLVAGLALAGLAVPVVGIRVVPAYMAHERRVAGLVAGALKRLGQPGSGSPQIHLAGNHLGRGYGHQTAAAEAVRQAALELEGLSTESTYTAKSLAGAIDWAHSQGLSQAPLLYWHTYNGADLSRELALANAVAEVCPVGLERYLDA